MKKPNQKNIFSVITIVLLSPFFANAQVSDLSSFFDKLTSILSLFIPILIGLGLLLFIWGLVKYLTQIGEAEKKEAINLIVYGVITLFVMVSIWGLVALLGKTFGISGVSVTGSTRTYVPGSGNVGSTGKTGTINSSGTVNTGSNSNNSDLRITCRVNPTYVDLNEPVTYSAIASGGSGGYSYSWTGAISGTAVQRTVNYTQTGVYRVKLAVFDSQGKSAVTDCVEVRVGI